MSVCVRVICVPMLISHNKSVPIIANLLNESGKNSNVALLGFLFLLFMCCYRVILDESVLTSAPLCKS